MKQFHLIVLLACFAVFYSCDDPALEEQFGKAIIYMPQATHNLGTDCNLPVSVMPSAKNDTTFTLGIYRSGLQTLESFSVDLTINADTVTKAKTMALLPGADAKFDIYKTGVLLAQTYYTPLPAKLTVPDGNREATTGLILNKQKILADYAVGSILLLPVQIKNPSKYEINKDLSLTMVVITVGK